MNSSNKFQTAYKLRFLPLVITGIALIAVSWLKYVAEVEVGKAFGWSIFLTFAAFIYYRALLEQKNKNDKEEELIKNPPPPPTKEEIRKSREAEIQGEIDQQTNNIIFRSVYLFFGLLVAGGGLSIILENKAIPFGLVILAAGVLFSVHSVFVLRKWIRLSRAFKEEKKKLKEEEL